MLRERSVPEGEQRELRLLQLFRSSSTAVQKEIVELLEFKAGRDDGGEERPQRGAPKVLGAFPVPKRRCRASM